jgi:hypothetical protein
MKKIMFMWLDLIAGGTNKKQVKKLLTVQGLCYVFKINENEAKNVIAKWKKKRGYK